MADWWRDNFEFWKDEIRTALRNIVENVKGIQETGSWSYDYILKSTGTTNYLVVEY